MNEIMEFLVDHRSKSVEPISFSDLFGRMVWLHEDNGRSIIETLGLWLESEDAFRVMVALRFDEAFLFDTKEEMVTTFKSVSTRWPEYKQQCDAAIGTWDKQIAKP